MKTKFMPAALLLLASTSALAATPSGYTGPNAGNITTVAAAHNAPDDAPVTLQGTLVQKVKGDTYEFRDATGSIQVEIDHDKWPQGRAVNENTPVRLHGEVDKDLTSREIDVDRVEVVEG
ncbi:NirD/YgiW/YdeI family stress tolerance protein [Pseudomonas sp. NPDC007930]|uniref:NirD/YgiW/YdeI family stress tolerance protein n=1 Tax=Pseudomonas sp. NPDC007930 TaxID=3364417 RepID=UPI0036EDF32A